MPTLTFSFCFSVSKSCFFLAILPISHAPLSLLFTVVHETGVDRVEFNEALSWGPGHTLCWCWVWLLHRKLLPRTLNSSYRPAVLTAEPFVWDAQLRKCSRKSGRRAAILVRFVRRQANRPPWPSILLANVQSLDNKLCELKAQISFQWDEGLLHYLPYRNLDVCGDSRTRGVHSAQSRQSERPLR